MPPALVEVDELVAGEYKRASVSAFERGDRGITVWRATGLTRLYGATLDALVAEAMPAPRSGSRRGSSTLVATAIR